MERIDILGSKINATNMCEVLKYTDELIRLNKSNYVCVSNVHTVVTGTSDRVFQDITNAAIMAIPDGMPLTWIGRHSGYKNMSKCSGPDVMTELFKVSEEKGYTHYFYGGSEETLKLLEKNLKNKYPKLKILGMYSPPFRKLTDKEDCEIVNNINKINPDIIWVGLGAPKQEVWMSEHIGKINSSLMFGVGAAFNFHAGTVRRAPLWMQEHGLEWLYRFIREPGRLWKRYLVTNTIFILELVKMNFKRKQS